MTQVWGCPPVCPCAAKAGRGLQEEWPQHSHSVPQPGPYFKAGQNCVNGEVLEGQELLGSPGALTTGREAMQDLMRWPDATGGCSSAGFVPVGLSHEEVARAQCLALGTQLPVPAELGAEVPCSRQRRKQEGICMLWLHPASTKLPADEPGRTSCLFLNLWQQKQGGEGEGE